MKLGHNDHLVVGIRIYTWKGLRVGQMESNSVLTSNNFSTGQILMKLGHNDDLVVGIRIYTWNGLTSLPLPPGGWGRAKWGKIVLNS